MSLAGFAPLRVIGVAADSSSGRIRNAGVCVSSNCPVLTAQINAHKKLTPKPKLTRINRMMIGILIQILFAAHAVAPQANNTTERELSGIRIAQMIGESMPAAAMLTPTML